MNMFITVITGADSDVNKDLELKTKTNDRYHKAKVLRYPGQGLEHKAKNRCHKARAKDLWYQCQ